MEDKKFLVRDIDLAKLFGNDRAQEDLNLQHYFIKTRQYNEIKLGNKELVLGRKGSGKSALFSILKQEARDNNLIPISIAFDGEDFVHIESSLKAKAVAFDIDDDFKYSLAWKDFLIAELLYQSIEQNNEVNKELREILESKGYLEPAKWKRFMESLLRVIKGVKVQGRNTEIEIGLPDFDSKDIPQSKIKQYLNGLITTNQYLILIDNLDEPWKNTPAMNSWLRGLMFAIRQLKREYSNIKVIAFLRTDIFDIISRGSDLFDSKSEITTLNWDDNNYYNLRRLIAARIAFNFNNESFELSDIASIDNLWNRAFPKWYNYGEKKDDFWHYIITRTFQRPRELLQFCRLMFEESQKKYLPLEENIISPVELKFSNWKEIDLVGEYSKSYKHLDKCIESFIGEKTSWRWTSSELIEHFDKLSEEDSIYNLITDRIAGSKESIEILYKIGFLRKLDSKHPGRYKTYYQDSSINYQLSKFDIHPAFRKKFTNC